MTDSSLPPLLLPYRQQPGDSGELLLGAEQDHEEEDGGEDPQSDSHKHHPTIRWHHRVVGAGYQRPVEQPQKLEGRQRESKMHQRDEERDKVHSNQKNGTVKKKWTIQKDKFKFCIICLALAAKLSTMFTSYLLASFVCLVLGR